MYCSDFQPLSSHGTHELYTKIWQCTKKYIFADLTKNGYNFDSFTPDIYCYVGCCHFKKYFFKFIFISSITIYPPCTPLLPTIPTLLFMFMSPFTFWLNPSTLLTPTLELPVYSLSVSVSLLLVHSVCS